ncbi:MAG: SLC13 family permease [Spirochaetales bacterium]|nr:SLC13 family permease [Spirochaetales bacterium]
MKNTPSTTSFRATMQWVAPRPILALATFCLPFGAMVLRPLELDIARSFLLGTLAQVVIAWASGYTARTVASLWLIAVFLFVGNAPVALVLAFPLSENFLLIASAFLLAAAVSGSGLSTRLIRVAFGRFAASPRAMIGFSFVAGTILSVFIPQPFPRVIVLSSLYASYLAGTDCNDRERRALLLSVFVASTGTSMLTLTGDVVLNGAALGLTGSSMTYLRWAELMLVPSLVVTLASYVAIVGLFRVSNRRFSGYEASTGGSGLSGAFAPLSIREKTVALVAVALVAAWMSGSVHGVSAAWCGIIAVAVLFALKAISFRDLREIDPALMLFLTAAFSIGPTLASNGIAERLNDAVLLALPGASSPWYFPGMVVVVMGLHLVLGSALTTMSVAIPALAIATADVIPPELVGLLVYSVITMQYVLPVHHVTIMMGAGKGYYGQRDTVAFGLVMALVMPLYVTFILVPWWRLVGAV